MQRCWHKTCPLVLIVLLVASFSVSERLVSQAVPPTLLTHATRLIHTKGILSSGTFLGWAPQGEAVYLSEKKPDEYGVVRRNVRTGREAVFPSLNPKLTTHVRRSGGILSFLSFKLSPDSKWLLWLNGKGKQSRWIVSSVDGSHAYQWVASADEGLKPLATAWLPNSRRFVTLSVYKNRACLFLYSLDTPNRVQKLDFPRLICDGVVEGILPKGFVLVQILRQNQGREEWRGDFLALGFDAHAGQVRKFSASLPPRASIQTAALSPQGNRLAWILWIDPLPGAANRGQAKERHSSSAQVGIWVCHADGSRMREIGRLPVDENRMSESFTLDELNWLPDDKRVSFVYRGTFYAIRTD